MIERQIELIDNIIQTKIQNNDVRSQSKNVVIHFLSNPSDDELTCDFLDKEWDKGVGHYYDNIYYSEQILKYFQKHGIPCTVSSSRDYTGALYYALDFDLSNL